MRARQASGAVGSYRRRVAGYRCGAMPRRGWMGRWGEEYSGGCKGNAYSNIQRMNKAIILSIIKTISQAIIPPIIEITPLYTEIRKPINPVTFSSFSSGTGICFGTTGRFGLFFKLLNMALKGLISRVSLPIMEAATNTPITNPTMSAPTK